MVFGTAPDALPKHSVHGAEASEHLPNQKSFWFDLIFNCSYLFH